MHSVGFLVLKLCMFTRLLKIPSDLVARSLRPLYRVAAVNENPADWDWSEAEKEQRSYYSCVPSGEVDTAGMNKAHS